MDCTRFSILRYGVFDSERRNNPTAQLRDRMISLYEFEFYTEDCEGGLILDGKPCPVRQGMVCLAKPGQHMRAQLPYKCYYANFSTTDPELKDLLDHLPNSFSIWNMDKVIDHLQKMIALAPANTIRKKMALQSHVCSIFAILCRYRQSQEQTARNVFAHQKTLLMVDSYMREHISQQMNLAFLAKLCNLDPTYFHKLYTAAFGKTPAQRLLYFRINAARVGLLSGNMPMSELAEQCGFSSQTYFCYKFRQATGKTPTQYRDEQLGRQKN